MIVLKFGVRAVTSGLNAACVEMRTAHHLFNALVAIERWKRKEYAAIRSRYVPGLGEVEAAYEQLSEEIGAAHAGPGGERGKIREKRQKATAASGVPTKRVDDSAEQDAIAEMKAWRKAASEKAKPLRAEFNGLVGRAPLVYEARTRGVPIEWLEERERLAAAGEPTAGIVERIEAGSMKTHAKKMANARVREAMLTEPEWHEAWKDVARMEAVAYDLRAWVGDAHTLNHGTYTAVADDVVRAGKRPKPRPDGEPRKPRQRPAFSSRGLRKLGWQIQGGIAWSDVLAGKCQNLRVTDVHPVGGSGHRWRANVGIRISTAERGVSEWVTCDTVIHRPVPADTRVLWVYLVPEVHRDGRVDYSVQLTVTTTEPLIRRARGEGHAHVEFCWTKSSDTLCVARINGDPLCLPARIPERIRHAEHLRGKADLLFDQARVIALAYGLGDHRSPVTLTRVILGMTAADAIEQGMRAMSKHAVATPGSLAAWHTWRDERLAQGFDLFAPLEEVRPWAAARDLDPTAFWLSLWRRKNKHLRQMEQGNRDHAKRGRTDYYRVTAARLSEAYETVSFGGAIDLAALALRDKSEDRPTKELHEAARQNRVIAAVGELRACLEYTFGRERLRDAPDPGGSREPEKHPGSDASVVSVAAAE